MGKKTTGLTKVQFPGKPELMDLIFEKAQAAIVITEHQTIRYINSEFTNLFGYSKEDALGHTLDELIIPESNRESLSEQAFKHRFESGKKISYETVRSRKSGRKIYVSCRTDPILVDDQIVGCFIVYADISEQVRAKKELKTAYDDLEVRIAERTSELKKSQKRFKDLFEQSIDAIIIHKNGLIVDVNNSMCELLGYSREQFSQMPVLTLHVEEDKQNLLKEVKKGRDFIQYETRWVRADGTFLEIELSSNPIDIDEQLYQVIARDIGERKEAERRLKLSEELTRVLVENIDITLNLIDTDYNILMANTASAQKRGLELKDILGKKCYEIFEHRQSVCPHCSSIKAIKTGKPQQAEITVNNIELGLIDLEFQFFPVFGEDGSVTGFVETARDFTQAKKDAIELEKAREAAVQASTAKSEFLANMSHEIRTPLNGVMGVLNLLLSTNPDNEQLDLIETGKRSADNLLTIINDVLDFSKIEAGELDIEILNFNLRTSIAEIVELPAIQAHNKGLEIIYEIKPDVPVMLKGDPGRLRQILLNLTGNAIKFTENGEIVISISVVNETDEKAKIKFEVRDTGIGIPEDKLDLVFESFKQTDTSTTRMYGGTGLGLSISKKLSELMGGEIGVTSQPGFGSTFWFTAQFDRQHDAEEVILDPPPDIRGKRFLVVDDNKTNQTVLKGYLESWGCICDLADSGEMALSMMNAVAKVNAPFDAVIVDMQMPRMDGAGLGSLIKEDPVLKDTTLIMLTSQGMRGDASRMEKIGFAAYLTKPVRRSQLFDCLISVFSKQYFQGCGKGSRIITRHTISEARRKKIRILLVEDNIINQKLALKFIEKFGFQADCAANGKEAVKALESFRYDIVLMDIQMPEMDGLEATKIIRSSESMVIDHDVKIIAMTAHAMQGDRDRCIDAGMNDYTNKPIQPQELLEVIERQIKLILSADESAIAE